MRQGPKGIGPRRGLGRRPVAPPAGDRSDGGAAIWAPGLLARLRTFWRSLDPGQRWLWGATIPLGAFAAVLEATGAGAVYALVWLFGDASALSKFPFVRSLVERMVGPEQRPQVIFLTALVAVLYIVKNSAMATLVWLLSKSSAISWTTLSRKLLRGYLKAPLAFHLKTNSAVLIHQTVGMCDVVLRHVFTPFVSLLTEILVISGLLTVLLLTAPGVTLVAGGLLFGSLALLSRLTRQTLSEWGKEENAWLEAVLRRLKQAFEGIREIKLLGREEFLLERFEGEHARMVRTRQKYSTLSQSSRLVVETVFVTGILVVILGVTLGDRSTIDVIPVLGIYAYAGFRIIPSVNRILMYVSSIRFGLPSLERVDQELRFCAAVVAEGPGNSAPLPFRRELRVERLGFAYEQGGEVLRGLDLVIQRGESIGIVGTTGAGKTTLVNLILGLLDPVQGRITVDGIDIRSSLPSWRRQVGYVPQSVFLLDDTLRHNIAFAQDDAEIDAARLERAVARAQLASFVAGLPAGLDTEVGERGVRLSGGERQRVAIARALYQEPEVLVFDEATSALDPRTEQDLTHAVEALQGETTLILIAHRLSTVQRCDRIVLLEGGAVVASGSFDELMRDSEPFRRLAVAREPEEDGGA